MLSTVIERISNMLGPQRNNRLTYEDILPHTIIIIFLKSRTKYKWEPEITRYCYDIEESILSDIASILLIDVICT